MTIKEARRLQTGQSVTYKGVIEGIVVALGLDSVKIQWQQGGPCAFIEHKDMADIEKVVKPGRYDHLIEVALHLKRKP
jgi:hypothetical protein